MQNTQQPQGLQRAFVTIIGLTVGACGFFLSFLLAILMLVRQGNPGFLLIWIAAVVATGACMHVHAKWRRSFERMYAPESVRTFYPSRKNWRHNVEDISFRDIPDTSMSFSQ